MQLLMRRPEIDGFISVAPPANLYDFSFLAPCPSSGLMINGDRDRVVPVTAVKTLVDKLKTQRGIVVSHEVVAGANHFFEDKVEDLTAAVERYLDKRAAATPPKLGRKEKAPPPPPVEEIDLPEEKDEEE